MVRLDVCTSELCSCSAEKTALLGGQTNFSTATPAARTSSLPHGESEEVHTMLLTHEGTGNKASTSLFSHTGVSRSWTLSSVDSVPVVEQQYSMADYISSGNGEADFTGMQALD